ncbi:MAG: hypothetical protein CME62_02650 [Halobacteriovoraceae bacterium]|nr:hypothetical protein [Halobacteriovoraceae bacterium]|tara:strand:+ start:44 stop:637 length:594 start_codon:yes stop_codon:yes gene_type:complete
MIEINLSPKQKNADITKVAGFDLSQLNLKMLLISIIVLYGVEPFVLDFFQSDIDAVDARLTKVQREQRSINTELRALESVKKQVEDLNKQEIALSQRVNAVKIIVDKRQNPFKIFKYIADNTPQDVWLFELELDDRTLKLQGYSKSWKSIGDFLENLKSSIFFEQNITFNKPDTKTNEINGQRVETFEIIAKVARFQ